MPPNRIATGGVLSVRAPMDMLASPYPETLAVPETTIEQEFEHRLTDCSRLAFQVALGVLHNRADAEEIAQEAFIRAHRSFAGLREPGKFRSWIVRITFRLALDRIRSDRRRQSREEAALDPPLAPTVEELAASREFRERLRRAVDRLPKKLRIVLVLAAIEGHDTREVMRLLQLPEGTVKSRLFQARKILAETLR